MTTPITIKDYFALAGSRFTDKDARAIGPVLAELSQQKEVTPAAVVEAAQSANCPLHAYFEWNDTVAAGKYREGQASEIINTIRVRVVSQDDGQERSVRAYRIQHLEAKPLPSAWAESTRGRPRADAAALRSVDEDEIVADALRDLQAWRLKYRPMAEFLDQFKDVTTVIMNQIGEFLQEFEAQPSLKPMEAIEDLKLWLDRHGGATTAAAQFAEQFKYMRLAIEDAEKAFDPDTALEGPLAQENRMLRERIAELEGGSDDSAVALRSALNLTWAESRLLKLLAERPYVTRDAAIAILYDKDDVETVNVRNIDSHIRRIRKKVRPEGIEITSQYGDGYSLDGVAKSRMLSILERSAV